MPSIKKRVKLTLSINREIRDRAKKISDDKKVPLSRLVENYLDFLSNPVFYCFGCSLKFGANQAKLCSKCGWMICPECTICRCGLNEEIASALFHMRRVYEDLLVGKVK